MNEYMLFLLKEFVPRQMGELWRKRDFSFILHKIRQAGCMCKNSKYLGRNFSKQMTNSKNIGIGMYGKKRLP